MPDAVSATSATTGVANPIAPSDSPLPTQTLGQNDFLKLLVAQMTAQDPMNPMSNTDFVAQMAQFSSLQAATSMQSDLSAMRAQDQVAQANSLLGRRVTLDLGSGQSAQGTVSAVNVVNGAPVLVVNGQPYDPSQVIAVQMNGSRILN